VRILLVEPKAYGDYPGASHPHLGLAYLASILLQRGMDVEILDMRLGYTLGDLISKIRCFAPDLVGVTCFSIRFSNTRKLVNKIKEQGEQKVILGGPHVSAMRSEVLRTTKADFAVKGEGEYTLLELCNFLEPKRRRFHEIKGLIWRDEDKIVENEDRAYIKNLDDLPFPAFEEFELEKYTFYKEKRLPIITSRGCPYRCIYCSVRLSVGQNFRPRSPENVIQELEHWYERGWKVFDFHDDCFTFDLERAKRICDLIVERGIKIKWYLGNGIRVDRIDRELLMKMKRAGCVFVCYGVESGNNQVLRAIRKGITVEMARKAFEMTCEAGIDQAANFIIGHPTETLEKALETVKFAQSIPVNHVNFYNLIPYPRTELFRYVEEHGTFLQPKETYLEDTTSRFDKPIFETEEFPGEDREKVLKIGLSFARKKLLQHKFGWFLGYLLWGITKPRSVNRMTKKLALGSKWGRMLFNLAKKL